MKSVVKFYIATSIGEIAQNMKSMIKFYIATSIGEMHKIWNLWLSSI